MNEHTNERPLMLTWPVLADPTLLDKIIDVVADVGRIERSRITPDATLDTLGLESMDVVMILMGLEDVLDTYIPMNADLAASRNMAELVSEAVKEMERAAKRAETSA